MWTAPLPAAFLPSMGQQPWLLLLCLLPVLVGMPKQLVCGLMVHGLGELVKGRRYFGLIIEDCPLLQQQARAGPFDHKSLYGWMSCPGPKFLKFFSSRGFTAFLAPCFFTAAGSGPLSSSCPVFLYILISPGRERAQYISLIQQRSVEWNLERRQVKYPVFRFGNRQGCPLRYKSEQIKD